MIHNKIRSRRVFLYSIISFIFVMLITVGITLSNINFNHAFNAHSQNNDYTLVLDSHNAVSQSGTYNQAPFESDEYKIRFTYTNASGSSGNHVRLASGGTIVNVDIIHSISAFVATFEGDLQARVAYKNETSKWGSYFDLVSGQAIELGTHPYFLELKAGSSGATLQSATYSYTCEINEQAEERDDSGSWDITFAVDSGDGTTISTSTDINLIISSGAEHFTEVSDSTNAYYAGSEGFKVGKSGGAGSITLNLAETIDITTVVVRARKYNSNKSSSLSIGSAASQSLAYDYNNYTYTLNTKGSTSISFNGSQYLWITNMTINFGSKVEPGKPDPTEIGFYASDANKDNYTTNSIFDNNSALTVEAIDSEGGRTPISKGGADGYRYEIVNPIGQTIDTSSKFVYEGEHTLSVYYKDYLPIVSTFIVGEYIYIEEITPSLDKSVFTTADVISTYLTGKLTAEVTYSNDTTETIQYASFASKGLGVRLINPKGFTNELNEPFGSDGHWNLMVYRLDDENIFGYFALTVNAIPVETITLNETTKEMHPGDDLQLITTVNPTTATNDSVYWSSNNEDVATVDDNGLVHAVSVGGAIITVTAADGSGVMAQCNITVTSAPVEPYEVTFKKNSTDSTQSITNYTTLSAQITSGEEYFTGANFDSDRDKVYASTSGLRLGSNKGNGYFELLCDSTKVKGTIQSLTVSTVAWDGSLTFYVNDDSSYSQTTDDGEATLNVNDSVTSITFVSSGRIYLSGFSLNRGSDTPVTPVYPESIELSGNNNITVGETSTLSIAYTPDNTNVKNVTYKSSNEAKATVSSDGIVTGVGVGSATITATAEAAGSTTVTDTLEITISPIAVSSISFPSNQQSVSVKVGKTTTLTPTIYPNNATNKNVSWLTSDASIASVSNGVVTGNAAGTATITVTTEDGGKSASSIVTVSASATPNTWELVTDESDLCAGDVIVIANNDSQVVAGALSSQVLGQVSSTFSSSKDEITELSEGATIFTLDGSSSAWNLVNEDGEELGATSLKKLAWGSGSTDWLISIDANGDATIYNSETTYGRFLYNSDHSRFTTYTSATSSTMKLPQIYRGGAKTPIDPTSIILSDNSIEKSAGSSHSLTVSYVPSNANQNKQLTWQSSNESVAKVNNGEITIQSGAQPGQTAKITAYLTNIPTVRAECTVTVSEPSSNAQTLMIYLCGADLESGTDDNGNVPSAANAAGYASSDIDEILSVAGQPDNVNIIIETGGANVWQSGHSYSISKNNLERWHVENRSLVKDETITGTYKGMGRTATFQSFLKWGLTNYPADRTGVILWNHGGGMRGVCYDEKDSDVPLLNNQVHTALGNVFTELGITSKLEWIAYDACLMAVQDIAEFNSDYFKYQLSSQESEVGDGYAYNKWIGTFYECEETLPTLELIASTFITSVGGTGGKNKQTQSVIDLSLIGAYKTAWENLAEQLETKLTNDNKADFNNAIIEKVKHYADSDYDYFCLFDAIDFVNKLESNSSFSNFRVGSSYTTAVKNAMTAMRKVNIIQSSAGNSNGLCMYWPNNATYSNIGTYYTTSQTNFTKWRSLCSKYGVYKN